MFAIELAAKPIPLPRRPGEEGLALALLLGQEAIEAEAVLLHGRPRVGLLARQQPQSPRAGLKLIEDRAIEVIGPLPPPAHPFLVGEDFQMPADGGLRHLEDIAQVGDAQLVALEQAEEAQARRIGERFHPGEEALGLGRVCGGMNHP